MTRKKILIEQARSDEFVWTPEMAKASYEKVRPAVPRETSRVTFRPQARPRHPAIWWAIAASAAAAILLAVLVPNWQKGTGAQSTAQSTAGPKHRTVFSDGSEAAWSMSNAAVQASQSAQPVQEVPSDGGVLVEQTLGEVTYVVRKQSGARRFQVDAGDLRVVVHGTVFTVVRDSRHATVSVAEGEVAVWYQDNERRLTAGRSLRIDFESPSTTAPAAPRQHRDEQPPDPAKNAAAATDDQSDDEVSRWIELADLARAQGQPQQAVQLLERALAARPGDPRRATTLFTLARIRRSLGEHAAAARAFERCALTGGTLALDAQSEAVASWLSAGNRSRALAAARLYVERYPSGPHAARMQELLDE